MNKKGNRINIGGRVKLDIREKFMGSGRGKNFFLKKGNICS